MSATSINRFAFEGCTKLKELDCRYATERTSGDPHIFYNCSSLVKLNLASFSPVFGYSGGLNNSRSIMNGCTSLKRLIMPSLTHLAFLAYSNPPQFTLMDFGPNFTTLCSSSSTSYNTSMGITSSTVMVIRRPTPATGNATQIARIKKLYVPANSVEDWKTSSSFSSIANYIFAIGGAEWIAEFGSADEYANLTEQEYADTYGWLAEQE